MDKYLVMAAGPIDPLMNDDMIQQAMELLRPIYQAMGYNISVQTLDEADLLLAGFPIPKDSDV